MSVWIKLGLVLALLTLLGGAVAYIDSNGYKRGYRASTDLCTNETVPTALELQKFQFTKAQAVTEKSNDQEIQDARAVADRLKHDLASLQRSYAAIPCVSIQPLGNQSGAVGVPPSGRNVPEVSAGWLLDFAARSERRSLEYLNCRKFVLDADAFNHSLAE